MRYLFGFLCVCTLGALPLVGCGSEAAMLCEGVECEEDGNECTSDECNPATGMCEHVTVEDDTACDFDGLPGLCKAGVCEDAMLCEGVECEDDDNQCTNDVCDPATGTCGHVTVEDDTACDFGGSPGLCKAGVCVDAMLCEGVVCDDDNECTNDVCNPATGNCDHSPVENGTGCTGGVCREGICGPLCIANVCHCSEAGIRAAIEGGGTYPYTFNCDGPTTVMTGAEIEIDNDVILDGEGNLTVDGNESHRVFSVASGVTAELRGMTVTRGAANGDGGGIKNSGELALTRTTVSSNSSGADDGGGIWNQGTLRLTECAVMGNTATAGGGIENYFGSAELNRTTVSGNTAVDGGGGAIRTGTTGHAALLLTNTTVSGNIQMPGRGAIENHDEALVISSTLQQLPVGNGSYVWDGGWVMFMNTILNGECVGWQSVDSYGGNIESPGDTCNLWPGYDYDWVSVSEAELDLGPLQDNDGPTLTHIPGPSSVAIDRIEPYACVDANWDPLETDQRGVGRPQGPLCDVGSVEAPSLCGGVDCDDQNECTSDRCNPADASCSHDPVPDGRYCYFGGGGNGGAGGTGGAGGIGGYVPGVCSQGECIPDLCWGNPCDDGNPCTSDYCDSPDGSCTYEPVPDEWYMYCDLGAGGSGGSGGFGGTGGSVPGICVQGECVENPCWGNPCDDGNDCTSDDCSFPDGSCSYTDRSDGEACNNNTGECLDGVCQLYPYCGEGESIGVGFMTDRAMVSCDGLGVIIVPIEVVLAAKPQGVVIDGEETDYDVQVQLILSEDTVDELGNLVLTVVIGESSADVDDGEGGTSLNVPATVPCYIDFTEDPDDNGTPGPVVVTTPVVVQGWTAIDGGLTLQAPHMTFLITQPVPLNLSTKGDTPACSWELDIPTVTFESGSGGNGG